MGDRLETAFIAHYSKTPRTAAGRTLSGDRWEYKIVHVSASLWTSTGLPADINLEFDHLGAEGWELVSTEAINRPGWFATGSTTVGIVGFFKRRLWDEGRAPDA